MIAIFDYIAIKSKIQVCRDFLALKTQKNNLLYQKARIFGLFLGPMRASIARFGVERDCNCSVPPKLRLDYHQRYSHGGGMGFV